MLAMLAATVIPTQCIEHGWFCPVPLTGDLCIDVPGNSFCEFYYKTAVNISSLYQLDALDWTVLIIYFGILAVLAIYGVYRIKLVAEFWRYSTPILCQSRISCASWSITSLTGPSAAPRCVGPTSTARTIC